TYVNFFNAYEVCRQEKSFIAVPQNHEELEMFRDVIIPYKLNNSVIKVRYGRKIVNHGGFWAGLKSWGRTTFAIDGTNSIFKVDTSRNSQENNCQAMYYETILNFKDGYVGVSGKII
uniref:C-type lectin domain-containing protein n=1 Tax=Panagrolaimus sp. PS1159 TaxID=55785 RepID=A0AC35ET76_9BILA